MQRLCGLRLFLFHALSDTHSSFSKTASGVQVNGLTHKACRPNAVGVDDSLTEGICFKA